MASQNGSHSGANTKKTKTPPTPTTVPLYLQFPANSSWEISLTSGETVTGTVYCTDEVSNTIFLQKNLTHTTLATELFILHAAQITQQKALEEKNDNGDEAMVLGNLPKVQKKVLEEREKKAIRMAEESFRHINQKVRLLWKGIIANPHWYRYL